MNLCVKFFQKFHRILLIFFPAVIFFSYHPVISLGTNEYMNFDLSLVEIWLVLFALSSIPSLKRLVSFFGWPKLLLSATIPLYCSLSSLWSGNPLRAVLTSGILWLVVFAVLNIIVDFKSSPTLRPKLLKILLATSVFFAVICWVQCILDLAGVSREFTLLCRGCTYTSFGFPHPNGFAIEPQFMGGLFLAPVLLCFYLLFLSAPKSRKQKVSLILVTLFLTSTLFLTLSRGAIYSFGLGLVVLFVFCCTKRFPIIKYKLKSATTAILLVIVAFSIAIVSEGFFAAISPTNDTFFSGITKSIHQLSLGVIDLRSAEFKSDQSSTHVDSSNDSPTSSDAETAAEPKETTIAPETSSFSGYVAESTNVRLSLNSLALGTWSSSPQYIVIGTGLGSAGIAMHTLHPEDLGPKEIVQNEYVSLLLELGATGILIIAAVIIYALIKIPKNALLLAVLVSFAFSLLFFSGLPNALYIYLLPVLFATAKNNFFVKNKI